MKASRAMLLIAAKKADITDTGHGHPARLGHRKSTRLLGIRLSDGRRKRQQNATQTMPHIPMLLLRIGMSQHLHAREPSHFMNPLPSSHTKRLALLSRGSGDARKPKSIFPTGPSPTRSSHLAAVTNK